MSIGTGAVTATNGSTTAIVPARQERTYLRLTNLGSVAVALGGSGVTATTGLQLTATTLASGTNDSFVEFTGDAAREGIWAITPSSTASIAYFERY